MRQLHASPGSHDLLGGQQDPQSGGGDILQPLQVQDEPVGARQGLLQLLLQLRRGNGIQAALQLEAEGPVRKAFLEFLKNIYKMSKNIKLYNVNNFYEEAPLYKAAYLPFNLINSS